VTFPTFDSIDLGAGTPASDAVATAEGWETPEHIVVPPIFGQSDLEGLDFLGT